MARSTNAQNDADDAWSRRPHDLLAALGRAQREMEAVVTAADHGLLIDLVRYLTARADLDKAVSDWNRRSASFDTGLRPTTSQV